MQVAVSMLAGVMVGFALYLLTRKRGDVAVWLSLVLGIAGTALLVGSINDWLLPNLGRFGAIGIAMLSGIATTIALGCILRGQRRPLNWVALLVSAPPVLLLVVFGIGELLGPPH